MSKRKRRYLDILFTMTGLAGIVYGVGAGLMICGHTWGIAPIFASALPLYWLRAEIMEVYGR